MVELRHSRKTEFDPKGHDEGLTIDSASPSDFSSGLRTLDDDVIWGIVAAIDT